MQTTHEVHGTSFGDCTVLIDTYCWNSVSGVIDFSQLPNAPEMPSPNYGFRIEDRTLVAAGRSWVYAFGDDLTTAINERNRMVEAWKRLMEPKPEEVKRGGR